MRTDVDTPLFVLCGGGLSEIANAYLLEPKIANKLTLIWIGGPEYPDMAMPPLGYTSVITSYSIHYTKLYDGFIKDYLSRFDIYSCIAL